MATKTGQRERSRLRQAGSPNALLDAMAAGTPDRRDEGRRSAPETVDEGIAALLVPARKPEMLSAAMERLLRDATFAATLGENARQAAVRFSPSKYRESLMQIYERMAGRHLEE